VSDQFPEFDKKMDLDNDAYFLFSQDYEDIVTKFFENIKWDGKVLIFQQRMQFLK
jgi:ribosome biogenesis protein Nip4